MTRTTGPNLLQEVTEAAEQQTKIGKAKKRKGGMRKSGEREWRKAIRSAAYAVSGLRKD